MNTVSAAQSALMLMAFAVSTSTALAADRPQTVSFNSADGTELVGYVFTPAGGASTRHPAIVMLHGRGGPYSSNVNANCTRVTATSNSPCNASTLSQRHQQWGRYWAQHGYVAVLVDSFGPRDKGHGFGRGTHDEPERDDVNERTVRPLDAAGALAYMRARGDVDREHIYLQGWSNGGSTVLNVIAQPRSEPTFRAALAFYPGCGPKAVVAQSYSTSIPLLALLGSADEEVSPQLCGRLLERARRSGSPVQVITYEGASHDFDDPGTRRQSSSANQSARDDAMKRALAFIGER